MLVQARVKVVVVPFIVSEACCGAMTDQPRRDHGFSYRLLRYLLQSRFSAHDRSFRTFCPQARAVKIDPIRTSVTLKFTRLLMRSVFCCLPLIQSGRAKAENSAAAASAAQAEHDEARLAAIPLTSGRALTIGYLQALIDAAGGGGGAGGGEGGVGGRDGEVTSALHDELAYLLMEGLLVRTIERTFRDTTVLVGGG